MATEVTLPLAEPAGRSPATVVARRTARKAIRSGALWGLVFGFYVGIGALTFATTYKTAAQRARLEALFGSNTGLAALVGPARHIQTVAGYTAWKYLVWVSLIAAAWGLLTGTRLLRGEEDAGRWELLLAGQTTRRGAAGQALLGLAGGAACLWAVTAVLLVLVGQSSKVGIGIGASLYFALALTSSGFVFLAVGALAGQIAATRRQAAGYAAAVLGASFALRMVADSGLGLEWLRWATPLGWVEQLQPLTAPRPLALLPIAGLIAVLAGLTVVLAGVRDLGGAVVADRATARPRTRLLFGPLGLAVRLVRPTFIAWAVAIAVFGLIIGSLAKSAESALTSSPTIERALARLGAPGAGAAVYLGVTFLMMALVLALIGAGQVGVARAEEADGRLEHLLVRPVSRRSWLSGRVAVAVVSLGVAGLIAGLSAWLGAAGQNSGVAFSSLVWAGLNIVPPAICIVGIGVLAIGVWPRGTPIVVYSVIAWSLLVEVLAGTVSINHWLLDTSLFHEMTAAPAVAPDWTSAAVMVAAGAACAVVGGIAFERRDLKGE